MRASALVLSALAALCCQAGLAACAPHGLTVERLANPCGVDAVAPRFGWKMGAEAGATDVRQSACRVLVVEGYDADALKLGLGGREVTGGVAHYDAVHGTDLSWGTHAVTI